MLAALCAAGALVCAGQVEAAGGTFETTIPGIYVSVSYDPTQSMQFDAGYSLANAFITVTGLHNSDIYDNRVLFHGAYYTGGLADRPDLYIGNFAVVFSGDQVLSLYGNSQPTGVGPSQGPEFILAGDANAFGTRVCNRTTATDPYVCTGLQSLVLNDAIHIGPSGYYTQIPAPPNLDGEILFNHIPEPSTWALLLMGFFGMGTALRRNSHMPVLG
jgi:hypothetical protein